MIGPLPLLGSIYTSNQNGGGETGSLSEGRREIGIKSLASLQHHLFLLCELNPRNEWIPRIAVSSRKFDRFPFRVCSILPHKCHVSARPREVGRAIRPPLLGELAMKQQVDYFHFRTHAAALKWMLEHQHIYHVRCVPPKHPNWACAVEYQLRKQPVPVRTTSIRLGRQ